MYHGVKEKVRELRSAGKMYSEIRQILKLSIPKSTLGTWCKGIELDKQSQQRVENKINKTLIIARAKARSVIAEKRQKYLGEIYKNNNYLAAKLKDNGVAKIALAMLYLGEGSKTHRGSLMF